MYKCPVQTFFYWLLIVESLIVDLYVLQLQTLHKKSQAQEALPSAVMMIWV